MNKKIVEVECPIFYINIDNPFEVCYFRQTSKVNNYKLCFVSMYLTEPNIKPNEILYKYGDTNRYCVYTIPTRKKIENILNR